MFMQCAPSLTHIKTNAFVRKVLHRILVKKFKCTHVSKKKMATPRFFFNFQYKLIFLTYFIYPKYKFALLSIS